jgi:hypothetical protein
MHFVPYINAPVDSGEQGFKAPGNRHRIVLEIYESRLNITGSLARARITSSLAARTVAPPVPARGMK